MGYRHIDNLFKKHLTSKLAQGKKPKMRLTILVLSLAVSSCNCEDFQFTDTSCKPGNPAKGDYDPSRKERCDNHLDDNCDGRVNEGCDCFDGDTYTCGWDVGECQSATVTCKEGRWQDCRPPIEAERETCNSKDDDCDGITDNNLEVLSCWQGPSLTVFSERSICKKGVLACLEGKTFCEGQVLPKREECNNLDDDCDGYVDDNAVDTRLTCGVSTDVGTCTFGAYTCQEGELYCMGAVSPQVESCNNQDDDCDGNTDEDTHRLCATSCDQGIETCVAGVWTNCTARQPEIELCDNIDNDCNGETDDGLVCECTIGEVKFCREGMLSPIDNSPVSCGRGIKECLEGRWGTCYFLDTVDEKCNNWDDDCDGVIDYFSTGCGYPPSESGICRPGVMTCVAGIFGDCEGSVPPREETCNQLDDDCDGLTDEFLTRRSKVDMVFAIDRSGSMCNYVQALREAMAEYSDEFVATEHKFGLAVFAGWYAPYFESDYVAGPDVAVSIVTDFVDVLAFRSALDVLACNQGAPSFEPSYDAMYNIAHFSNPENLSWRLDAYPYVILVGDENGQSYESRSQSSVAAHYSTCEIGGCQLGDVVEVFVITRANYFSDYSTITYNTSGRLFEIDPAQKEHYLEIFRTIFIGVCR